VTTLKQNEGWMSSEENNQKWWFFDRNKEGLWMVVEAHKNETDVQMK